MPIIGAFFRCVIKEYAVYPFNKKRDDILISVQKEQNFSKGKVEEYRLGSIELNEK